MEICFRQWQFLLTNGLKTETQINPFTECLLLCWGSEKTVSTKIYGFNLKKLSKFRSSSEDPCQTPVNLSKSWKKIYEAWALCKKKKSFKTLWCLFFPHKQRWLSILLAFILNICLCVCLPFQVLGSRKVSYYSFLPSFVGQIWSNTCFYARHTMVKKKEMPFPLPQNFQSNDT